MNLNKKGKIIIGITLIVIALTLFTIYILKSGSEKFAILNLESVESVNDPVLKTAIETTEECNKLKENYKPSCYSEVAWQLGYYNEPLICEKLKEELKPACYTGYGRKIGKKYSPDIEKIKNECSKFLFYKECLYGAALIIGKESAGHIETEQCKKLEQEDAKRRCYEGIGQQLAEDNRQLDLCKKTGDEEACLSRFAYIAYNKGSKEEALQVCNSLSDNYAKKCHRQIGSSHTWAYNETIDEAFKDCDLEECKRGAAAGIAVKFFEEEQQKNKETASITTPIMSTVYKLIKLTTTKISLAVKQQIIPHFINYKLTYLKIILSSLGVILTIIVLRNKKVQKVIKKLYEKIRITTQKIYYISTKELLIIYKESKLIIRDILSIDKTTITSFSKELKTELGSKEGKKKL